MSLKPFILKNVKQKLTRHLNTLAGLLQEAEEFREPWSFPTQIQELNLFLTSKKMIIKDLMSKIEQQKEGISEFYAECNQQLNDIVQESTTDVESQFDEYWSERGGDDLLSQAQEVERKLGKRLLELECQEASLRQESTTEEVNSGRKQDQPAPTEYHQLTLTSSWTLERRLLGNELKIPSFHGNPSEFESFWELFEELVHKQPYSNIEKLSILIYSCKGDAARALQMIPRTGDSYERAVTQLKTQYQDPRRITIQMIRQLKSMKQCRDDHRSLRNNLSDVQAIMATLERQGEPINTTNTRSMVLDTFSKNVQDEMAKREFDSGRVWTMTDLLDNLTIAVKRKEHVDCLKEVPILQ